jgi:hypothetical protein
MTTTSTVYLVNVDNCDIEIEGAWDLTTGSNNSYIAVIRILG